MVCTQTSLQVLFEEAAHSLRKSVRQSNRAIVELARSKLNRGMADGESLNVLAVDCLLRGRPSKGLEYLKRSADLLRKSATANRAAGYACLLNDDVTKAERFFLSAAELEPFRSDTWIRLGVIQESQGDIDKAIQNYERGLFFEDRTHDCAFALARLYAAREDFTAAIASLRSAVNKDIRNPTLNERLAELLMRRAARMKQTGNIVGREKALDQAIEHFKLFVSIKPSSEVYVRLGLMQSKRERYSDAREAYESALRLDPSNAAALAMIASLNVAEGRIEESKEQFQEVFRRQDSSPFAHFRYARIVRFQPGSEADQYESRLRKLLAEGQRPVHHRISLLFALGKLLDDLGRHDEAWQQYAIANRIKMDRGGKAGARMNPATPSEVQKVQGGVGNLVNEQVRRVDQGYFEARKGWGASSKSPIFVVGMPRSGTTLTEQILSSHRHVIGAGELKHIEDLRRQLQFELRNREKVSCNCENGSPNGQERLCVMSQLTELHTRRMANAYLDLTRSIRGEAPFFIDKMPTNFMHLGLIAVMFPNAKIIHCRRDPLDVIVSAFCQNLAPPFCDLDAITDYFIQYRRLMAHWERVLPIKIHHLDYEQTVDDPRSVTRALLQHCDLEWDENCMSHQQNTRAVHTPSKWQVRQPIYSSSVGKWRRFAAHLESVSERIQAAALSQSDASGTL